MPVSSMQSTIDAAAILPIACSPGGFTYFGYRMGTEKTAPHPQVMKSERK